MFDLCNMVKRLCGKAKSLCNKNRQSAEIPSMFFFEGILVMTHNRGHLGTDGPHDPVGRTILGIYLIEISLKLALQKAHIPYGYHHNLYRLYTHLPKEKRDAVEKKHDEIFPIQKRQKWHNSENLKSVAAFLKSLGRDPITDTRYFWDSKLWNSENGRFIFMPDDIDRMSRVLVTALHDRPCEFPGYLSHLSLVAFEREIGEDGKYKSLTSLSNGAAPPI